MRQVLVTFGPGDDFEYHVPADEAAKLRPDDARQWLDEEFVELGCEVASPIGKVLSADLLLSVAKYSGAKRFREDAGWAAEFARNAAALVGRNFIRIDVPQQTVGF